MRNETPRQIATVVAHCWRSSKRKIWTRSGFQCLISHRISCQVSALRESGEIPVALMTLLPVTGLVGSRPPRPPKLLHDRGRSEKYHNQNSFSYPTTLPPSQRQPKQNVRVRGIVQSAHCECSFLFLETEFRPLVASTNEPNHLACSACGTPRGESRWVHDNRSPL